MSKLTSVVLRSIRSLTEHKNPLITAAQRRSFFTSDGGIISEIHPKDCITVWDEIMADPSRSSLNEGNLRSAFKILRTNHPYLNFLYHDVDHRDGMDERLRQSIAEDEKLFLVNPDLPIFSIATVNDIEIDDKKYSGHAFMVYRDRDGAIIMDSNAGRCPEYVDKKYRVNYDRTVSVMKSVFDTEEINSERLTVTSKVCGFSVLEMLARTLHVFNEGKSPREFLKSNPILDDPEKVKMLYDLRDQSEAEALLEKMTDEVKRGKYFSRELDRFREELSSALFLRSTAPLLSLSPHQLCDLR